MSAFCSGPGNRILYNFSHDNGRPPSFPGASGGNGILNNAPGTLIKDNLVQDNNRHGILVIGAVSNGVTLQDNRVFRNGSNPALDDGIRLEGASGNLVVGNESRFNRHNGYHLVNGANGNVVRGNIAERNGTPAAVNGCGIDVTASHGNVIEDNDVLGHDRAGIRLRMGSTGNHVSRNDLNVNPGDGILLANGDDNTLEDNDSKQNGGDGIEADSASAGNTIARNEMVDNVEHDCRDDSVGPGTAGTANFWSENSGKTQNRPGLCKP
jgi:parallel beta-helix repeat protein